MSCLDDLVGLKGCGEGSHSFYLNDLPAIKISDFDKAVSVESANGQELLNDIIGLAVKHTTQKINSYLLQKYRRKMVLDNSVMGYFYDDKEVIATQTGNLVGYEIRIDQVPYMTYYLHAIKLFANNTGTVPVYVYDLIQGKLLDTINITAVAGQVSTVVCEKTYSTDKQRLRLFIGYESTFDSYKTSMLSPYGGGGYETCGFPEGSYYGFSNYIYVRSAKIGTADAKIRANVNSLETTGGLSINYSLQCSFDEYLCSIANLIAMPIAYKAGALAMLEMKHSKRLTGAVTIYGKSHEELYNYYEAEHQKMMEEVLLNMSIPNSFCFECTPRVKSVVSIP